MKRIKKTHSEPEISVESLYINETNENIIVRAKNEIFR